MENYIIHGNIPGMSAFDSGQRAFGSEKKAFGSGKGAIDSDKGAPGIVQRPFGSS